MSLRPERKVPVLRSDFNLIDSEFSSVRERFENEMRKMEDEMNRFRSQLQDRERDFFGNTALTQRSHSSTSHTSSTVGGDTQHRSELNTWLDGLNSPLVQDSENGKVLKLRFDVTQYAPEEIVVKTVDNRLQVSDHGLVCEERIFYFLSRSLYLSLVLFCSVLFFTCLWFCSLVFKFIPSVSSNLSCISWFSRATRISCSIKWSSFSFSFLTLSLDSRTLCCRVYFPGKVCILSL